MRNTDKEYPCLNCGQLGNVIREGPTPSETRIKCNSCGFMYNASDSIAAKEQGAIPDGPPDITPEPAPEKKPITPYVGLKKAGEPLPIGKIPRTPSFVLVSKDRTKTEFATKKSLRQLVLKWEYESISFDVFELTPKAVSTKVDIT